MTARLFHGHVLGACLGRRRGRERYFEHAVIERCLDLIGIDPFRKGKRAIKQAEALLRMKVPIPVFLVLLMLLTRDREYPVVGLDANVFLLRAGNIGAYNELVASPKGVELREETGAIALIRIAPRLNWTLTLAPEMRAALSRLRLRSLVGVVGVVLNRAPTLVIWLSCHRNPPRSLRGLDES